jgi:DNA/RNA-binding domain of Phe-tRNA-synthetase-like protein
MTFSVSPDCLQLGLRAGAILFRDVTVGEASSDLRALIAQEVDRIRTAYADPQALRSLPEVVSFQEILRQVGVNPRKEQPSVERLLAFALRRASLPAINSLVDAYNLVSVRRLCSLGAHDLDKIALPVSLVVLTGLETFTALGRDRPQAVTAGEFGYVDAARRVLCRLDLLQADFSKVTHATRNALLIIEGTAGHAAAVLQAAFADAIEIITHHCGGTAEVVAVPW